MEGFCVVARIALVVGRYDNDDKLMRTKFLWREVVKVDDFGLLHSEFFGVFFELIGKLFGRAGLAAEIEDNFWHVSRDC